MENTYGIGVANRYALFLDDESDPLETLSLKEQEKELKKKTKVADKDNKTKSEPQAKTTKPTAPVKKTIKENANIKTQENKREEPKPNHQRANNEGKPERTFNKFNNENREEMKNRRNREERTYNGPAENRDREERPRRDNIGGNSGSGSGGIGGENFENRNRERSGRPLGNKPSGNKGPRKFDDRRGKREFDRQSGSDKTGVKPVDKREGGGAHNWGSTKDDIEEATKPSDPDQSWNDIDKPETNSQPEQKEETGPEAPVEEEPKELTLDEWKAQRAGRVKPQYNIRKAGEGEDPSQWKKMYELRKKENESQESEEEEYDVTEYPQRVGRQKKVFDIDIQFNDSRRGGGGRGRGQRSGPRGNRPNQRGQTAAGGGGGGGGTGGGGPGIGANSGGDRSERRYRDEQVDDKGENRKAPKVDDERDFPSLG